MQYADRAIGTPTTTGPSLPTGKHRHQASRITAKTNGETPPGKILQLDPLHPPPSYDSPLPSGHRDVCLDTATYSRRSEHSTKTSGFPGLVTRREEPIGNPIGPDATWPEPPKHRSPGQLLPSGTHSSMCLFIGTHLLAPGIENTT